MSSILKCKTYPSDTVVIQKISFVEQKPGDSNEIDAILNEPDFVCTRIEKIDRTSIIERTNSVKFDIAADIKSIDADENDNAVECETSQAEESAKVESNGNKIQQKPIDYSPFQNIPIPNDLKHDLTYDGSTVYRVDFMKESISPA